VYYGDIINWDQVDGLDELLGFDDWMRLSIIGMAEESFKPGNCLPI
jgi:hypothetical protein